AARAAFCPGVGANAGAARALTNTNGIKLATTDTLGLSASWIPDLWGATRRAVEAGDAGAAASADQLAGARLGVQALLAQDYLQLRVTDRLIALYADTTTAYERALRLVQSQRAAGVALASDVALAESQLKTAAAQAVDLQAQRSQLEHAIAVLTGRPPAAFTLAAEPGALGTLAARLPPTPVGVPSQLLERRPDIAAAERLAAQANANIGVARAAFYPSLTLGASAGFSSSALSSLFDTPSHVWSLGATLAAALFDGGLRQARSAQASAAYDAAAAQYKQTVLAAFQQVEDNLALLRVLGDEQALQDQAVEAAARAERLALAQYRGGTATYLAVVTAQTLALANQRTAVQLQGRQLLASVALITATGGGWDAATPGAPPAPIAARAAPSS
ncbi:MAG: efflux transporter outer membrane subunit, partial [Proteobacteria bacterium]|nr:efflux transporter outer membrane subunit [Pseudomonadota bacterium]